MNSVINYPLNNGKTVNLKLSFKLLYQLKSTKKEEYEKFNFIFNNGAKDVFDYVTIIYVAYLCGDNQELILDYDSFADLLEFDLAKLNQTVTSLISVKKK